jgi:uncharacterized protein YjbJ (UPF0337 family)
MDDNIHLREVWGASQAPWPSEWALGPSRLGFEQFGNINNSGQTTKEAEQMADKAKGKMKEAAGAITGDEEKKAEGRAQQRASAAAEEAAQKERTRQEEAKAKEAERERDRAVGRHHGQPHRPVAHPQSDSRIEGPGHRAPALPRARVHASAWKKALSKNLAGERLGDTEGVRD